MGTEPKDAILPLAVVRICFGLIMAVGALRFFLNGWIESLYLAPTFHFTYYGFGWVKPLLGPWLYLLFGLLGLSALCVAIGYRYRLSMISFFLLFTYIELIDKSYYLNHYYLVTSLSFLFVFLPLNRGYSLDARWRSLSPTAPAEEPVARWCVNVVRLQVGLVYLFAGIAKLNSEWLLRAMPMKIWLAARTDFPVIGRLFEISSTAYLMSWAGAIYDLTIVFFLLYRPTRKYAFLAVVAFHLMTALLFPIGLFPYLMIGLSLIFFEADELGQVARWVKKWRGKWQTKWPGIGWLMDEERARRQSAEVVERIPLLGEKLNRPPLRHLRNCLLILFFLLQLVLPLRHWLYPGNVLWTEEGFRFSWMVMLVEKSGRTTFTVTDPSTGRSWPVYPEAYLTPTQNRQMAYQPDMILAFAHFVADEMAKAGFADVEVRAESYVSYNGYPSRLLIDPTVDLSKEKQGWLAKGWILR